MKEKKQWWIFLFVLVAISIVCNFGFIVDVKPGERAVVYNRLTKEYSEPRQAGINFILPKLNEVTIYKVKYLTYSMGGIGVNDLLNRDAIEVLSNDGLLLRIDFNIGYHLDEGKLNEIHQEIGSGYEDKVIRPVLRETFRKVFADFSAMETYSSEGRSKIQIRLLSESGEELSFYHIILEELHIRYIKLPKEVEDAIAKEKAARTEKELEVYKEQKSEWQNN